MKVLKVALGLMLIPLLGVTTFYVYVVGHKLSTMLDSVNQATSNINDFVAKQKETLERPEYQLAIKKNLDIGFETEATLKAIRKTTLPRVNAAVDQMQAAGAELAKLTSDTNQQVTQHLLPAATRTVTDAGIALNTTTENANKVVSEAGKSLASASVLLNRNLTDLDQRLNDPNIAKAIQEMAQATANIRESTANIDDATKEIKASAAYAPDIMRDVEAFTRAQSKWSKWILGARLLSIVAPILTR